MTDLKNCSKGKRYKMAHMCAKIIVFLLIVILLIVGRTYDIMFLDILAVAVWFFGVNPVAWAIEEALHIKHLHSKI